MSDIVQSTIISYFDTRNAAGAYSSLNVTNPFTIHGSNNGGEIEEGGQGPFLKTFIPEEDWNKIDDQTKNVGESLTHTSFEEGTFIIMGHVWEGAGDSDLRAISKVLDKIKKDFVKLELPTTNGLIHFGASRMSPTIDVELVQGSEEFWKKTDLFILYFYAESYT